VKRLLLTAILLAAACAATDVAGTYESVLPAASGGGQRHIRVTLQPDGFAAVSSAFTGRPSRFLAEGKWQREGRRIAVTLDDKETMVFQHAGEELVAREWNRTIWGEAGPGVLTRVR
jgi:NlpE N-terminal domain